MAKQAQGEWPVLRTYDEQHLARIALPLGGIGTGTVALGGRGDLRDWELMNRPGKGFTPQAGGGGNRAPFFALYACAADGQPVARALEGPLPLDEYEGQMGSRSANHGLPRFRHCTFDAAYPFGRLHLSDPDVPLTVRLEAFNPLIPGDADRSGLPVAVLRYVLVNRSAKAVTATVCGNIPNFIGMDGSQDKATWCGDREPKGAKENRTVFRTGRRVAGLFMDSVGVPSQSDAWGTLALTTTARAGLSHRRAWAKLSWGNSLLDFWDDFLADGALEDRDAAGVDAPMGSLAVKLRVPPRSERAVTFLLTWHFPNRYTWTPKARKEGCCDAAAVAEDCIGNYYTTQFADAWAVAEQVAAQLPALEQDTLQFVRTFCAADLPAAVKEAALFNLTGLRTQTAFRTPDGRFYGWEGCCDHGGCCYGSCTHVWNYEQATAFLFGDLAKTMRDVEFGHATRDDGLMCFRVNLPLSRAQDNPKAAADGQMGCFLKLYRDWQLSGDDAFLKGLWPKVKAALSFCWLPGGWDADQDGVMEGCQHNTMDVEYYGPNPQMQVYYLGALRATEEMARHVGDAEFAAICHDRYERGREWFDAHLFNGEYYEHEIRPLPAGTTPREGLLVGMGSAPGQEPILQLGSGCLVDQLVGQFLAHVCGLGHLTDAGHQRTTLKSIMKYNWRSQFYGHFNHLRSFVLGDESALLMASYPRGRRPAQPFPYYNEVMTGFEYAAAVHMLYEGLTADGLKAITAIRERYDGQRRSPFDEAECGHHYARAMASWGAVLAMTGFHYSGVTQTIEFAAGSGTCFWANGYAWGTCRQQPTKRGICVKLTVLHGQLRLRRLVLAGAGEMALPRAAVIRAGTSVECTVATKMVKNRKG